ncbi:Gamma-glutamyltranspeptidase @ Glutathione hydrolase [hydrothermal vent metagenome]|uniref:Gamma-glutamyltranspeptidase @ Glutathione hydrolase n=1 Tax=hydrothermal vent metagenome TaxID=652676 RepID=A0A3B0TG69_9ZZZZ
MTSAKGKIGPRGGAVAAGHEATAGAAAQILADGGNAFDAAIAGLWMACVAEPILASPAGGGFLMAHTAGGTELFDFFSQTPRRFCPDAEFEAVTVDFGTATQVYHIGAGSAAVPGFVPGLYAVHKRLGQLAMPHLLAPAIAAARAGVGLTAFQAQVASLVEPILLAQTRTADHFAPGGALPRPGANIRNPELADTLAQLAKEGVRLFTHGRFANAMVAGCAQGRGHLTAADVSSYEVVRRAPLWVDHHGWRLALNPPPAAGGAMVGLTLALVAERSKNGAGRDRAAPEILVRSLAEVAAIRDQNAFDVARRICNGVRSAPPDRHVDHWASRRGTTHISVIDAQGNAVAATVSNGEGNGHMVGGFLMNNMLGEDDINPGGFGNWTPGTRLSSMMAPTLLSRGGEIVALGSGGSNRIRSAVAIVAARIAAGHALAEAIAGPRLHVEDAHLDFEDHFSAADRAALIAAFPDHRAWPRSGMFFGGVHVAALGADGCLDASADPRRDGAAHRSAPQ